MAHFMQRLRRASCAVTTSITLSAVTLPSGCAQRTARKWSLVLCRVTFNGLSTTTGNDCHSYQRSAEENRHSSAVYSMWTPSYRATYYQVEIDPVPRSAICLPQMVHHPRRLVAACLRVHPATALSAGTFYWNVRPWTYRRLW